MVSPGLATAFLAALDAPRRGAASQIADLEARLTALAAFAASTHPRIPHDPAALAVAIASHLPLASAAGDVVDYLEHCRAADLQLAIVCAAGSPVAIATFERDLGPVLDLVTRRFARIDHSADDLRQIILTRLFVGDAGGAPKILDYAGQGFLENWVRVTAVRTCIDLAKRKDRAREQPVTDDIILALPAAGNLELDYIKREYRGELLAALRTAAAALSAGDRHLLRQQFVGGLSIDQLAAVYGVHRATAARRSNRARSQLLADTRAALAQRLRVADDELDSVMGLVASRLDISISGLLASQPIVVAAAGGGDP